MNIFLNEYFGFCFELNFELNHFQAQFNEKMNFRKNRPPLKQKRQELRDYPYDMVQTQQAGDTFS